MLQLAALYDKPLLASSGPGPLREIGTDGMGLFVEPDSVDALVTGIAALQRGWRPVPGAFACYRGKASWSTNVDRLLALVHRLRAGGRSLA